MTTGDMLMRWLKAQREAGLEVLCADDPVRRRLGFSVPGHYAYLTLVDVREKPVTDEGASLFDKTPKEVMALLTTPTGRHWLATGEELDGEPNLPNAAPLEAQWMRQAEAEKPPDEVPSFDGPRPAPGLYVVKDGAQVRQP